MEYNYGLKYYGSSGSGKKGLNSEYIFEIELTGFAEGLLTVCKEKKSQV